MKSKYSRIEQDAISLLRTRVINQSRYQIPWEEYLRQNDAMYRYADTKMTDNGTAEFLKGKAIIADKNLLNLANELGLENLYDEDAWVDRVAEYILDNHADCRKMWDFMSKKAVKHSDDLL